MSHDDLIKTIVGFATSALGFLCALLINSYIGWWHDNDAYHSMMRAIVTEANSNKVILNDSFLRFYESGIVLREFSIETVDHYMNDPLFVKHAEPLDLSILNNYFRNLKLANAYRDREERFRLDEKLRKDWLEPLIDSMRENLKLCQASIDEVLKLK